MAPNSPPKHPRIEEEATGARALAGNDSVQILLGDAARGLADAHRSRHAGQGDPGVVDELSVKGANDYHASVTLGAGPVQGRFEADVPSPDLQYPRSATLQGRISGLLGVGSGIGHIRLTENTQGTLVSYDYSVAMTGKVAAIGGRMLDGATRALIRSFFARICRVSPRRRRPAVVASRACGASGRRTNREALAGDSGLRRRFGHIGADIGFDHRPERCATTASPSMVPSGPSACRRPSR